MKTLNVIGAGRVGLTLAALFSEKHVFAVRSVLDGTIAGARDAVTFIGAGEAAGDPAAMAPADVWMITTPDRRIAEACAALAESRLLRTDDVVFHCSGSLPATALASAATLGARVASVHPLKTFAAPADALRTFEGTPCVAEGDRAALAVLQPAFERIGARVLGIDSGDKPLYHAASVIVCNYLTALIETGLRCYEKAGVPRAAASSMIEPIVRETVDNIFNVGPARALTGPIARGDDAVVAGHLEVLDAGDPHTAAVYRELGLTALDLARGQGDADAEALARIETLLRR